MIRLRDMRKRRNLTLQELGDHVGLSNSAIYLYETGQRSPDPPMLLKLCDALDCTLDELMGTAEAEPVSKADQMLFKALDGATDEDKERAARMIMLMRNISYND